MKTRVMARPSPPAAQEPRPPGFLPWLSSLLFQDLRTKALALVFALLVWLYVNSEITTEGTFVLPVAVEAPTAGIMVTDFQPREIKLELQGPKEKIERIKVEDIARPFAVSPGSLGQGETTKVLEHLAENFFRLPSGVTLKNRPPPVKITVVLSQTRSLKVKLTTRGKPAEGFEVTEVRLEPNEVRLRGPVTVMERIEEVETRPVDIGGRRTASIQIYVDVPDRILGEPVLYLEARRIFARIEIAPRVVRKRIEVPCAVEYWARADFGYVVRTIKPAQVTVVVEGPQEGLEEAKLLRVYADLTKIPENILAEHHKQLKHDLKVHFLPPGFTVIRIQEGKHPAPEVQKVTLEMDKKP